MKEKRILDALNDIDERWIEDAAPAKPAPAPQQGPEAPGQTSGKPAPAGKKSPRKRILYKRLTTAAVLVLLLTGALFWAKGRFSGSSGETATEASPATTAAGMPETAEETVVPEAMIPQTEAPAETKASPTEADADDADTESAAEAKTAADTWTPETEAEDVVSPTSVTEAAGSVTDAAADPEAVTEAVFPETERVPETSGGSSDGPVKIPFLPGEPAESIFISYGVPEHCREVRVLGETDLLITDPEAIGQIAALLSPCRCLEAAPSDASEGCQLAFLSEEGSFTLTLTDSWFLYDDHYFAISEERWALLAPWLAP